MESKVETETFLGYCFDAEGRYPSPVSLHGIEQAVGYFKLQMPLHPRVMITDQRDYCVLEAQNGKITFPPARKDT
ncbi:hypothetical protein [Ethanoligenens harbinense]|uniref:hypothetical protein n=1 Tax=Ethanoligenens harbinense TaxID=253239 RepID=UPI0001C51DFA|nr:hypothetical protein [Ethanoligenens harbinense]AVQ96952.1 hypothetical protein CXQ68_12475 [Ethanoligenens harbinense YUAN-3]AYF39612.1 hypothetical protein CXP51_12370 [Ethanoligenens harbinense]AYF42440.1 hypothetical protein CN246_12925 [Ethanoligenens harbinense]QCN93193.1 hypothetical protein DRA42_12520 [Ethanoligenens harbinense]